jgi:hypothetical protein
MPKNVFVQHSICPYLYIIIANMVSANKRKRILLSLVTLILGSQISAQTEVWPGDVNNNGIVNNIDMLYWGLAKEATGPARTVQSTDWSAQELDTDWAGEFADGTNFGFADCNGDGVVDDDDLDVIKDNFGLEQPVVNPDNFTTGDPANDPILLLDPITTEVEGGDTSRFTLSLGNMDNEISEFFGVAFTINFDPDLVADETTGVNKKVTIDFDEVDTSWINQDPPNHAREEIIVDNEAGTAQVAIFRRNPGTNSGGGEFGVLSIVMVDIVLFSEQTPISVDKIKLINPELSETTVAPSEVEIMVMGDSTVATKEILTEDQVNIYPNPAEDIIWIETTNESNEIKNIELYNTLGQKLYSMKPILENSKKSHVTLSQYAPGLYLLRVNTAHGVISKLITR